MKNTKNVVILGLLVVAMTACSTTNQEKKSEYKNLASKVQALEVPPDLTVPVSDGRYAVPSKSNESAATYSDYNKGAVVKPLASTEVLPFSTQVKIERNGTQRWLRVNDQAENVWATVRGFWLEQGFLLESDDANAGVMVTDWLENKASLPQSGVRSALARVFDSMRPYGERDQFRTRLERSADGLSTEIYISHHGLQESPKSTIEKTIWLPRNNDPELENILLQQLMAKLIASPVKLEETVKAPIVSPVVAVDVQPALASVQLQEKEGGKVIVIAADFEKSWRKVGLALDKSRIAVEDKNRDGKIYFLRGSADKKITARYQVTVTEKENFSEVAVATSEGKSDKESLRLIELLFKNIEK